MGWAPWQEISNLCKPDGKQGDKSPSPSVDVPVFLSFFPRLMVCRPPGALLHPATHPPLRHPLLGPANCARVILFLTLSLEK